MEREKTTISMKDIAFMVSVLNVASRRGAFNLDELKPVGELGERLQAFLNDHAPNQQDETAQEAGQGEESTPEATE